MTDIIYDSRKAAPGLLFVCIVGTQRDSHELRRGLLPPRAPAVLVIQHDIDLYWPLPGVTVVKVESSRYAMALMSANLFGNPSRKMTMIGVTGTKGKTTTTHMIKSCAGSCRPQGRHDRHQRHLLHGPPLRTLHNTTPESYELQKTFRQLAGCGLRCRR